MKTNNKVFKRKEFDFPIPEEVETCITNLENAVLTNSTLLDFYLEELRALFTLIQAEKTA